MGAQAGKGSTLDASYRALSRARHEAASKKTRTMQVIEDPLQALRSPGSRSTPQKPKVIPEGLGCRVVGFRVGSWQHASEA